MERQSSFSRSGDNAIWSVSKVGADSLSVLIEGGRVFADEVAAEGSEEGIPMTVDSQDLLTCSWSRGRLQ